MSVVFIEGIPDANCIISGIHPEFGIKYLIREGVIVYFIPSFVGKECKRSIAERLILILR